MSAESNPTEPVADNILADGHALEDVPLCVNCLKPVHPLASICNSCGATLGPLAGVYPRALVSPPFRCIEDADHPAPRWLNLLLQAFFACIGVVSGTVGVLLMVRAYQSGALADFGYGVAMLLLGQGAIFCMLIYRRYSLMAKRRSQGLCESCGYSLRGLTGTRCPECGTELRALNVKS